MRCSIGQLKQDGRRKPVTARLNDDLTQARAYYHTFFAWRWASSSEPKPEMQDGGAHTRRRVPRRRFLFHVESLGTSALLDERHERLELLLDGRVS